MLIPEYNTLFIHIPKAAGQSIENFLLESLGKHRSENGEDYLLRPNNDPSLGPPRLAHLTAKEYVELGYISQANFDNYYKFAFVRNPWARIFSLYKFRGFANIISFEIFVQKYLPKYYEEEHWFFRPQTDFIYNEKNRLLMDYVGKLENIDQDFGVIAEKLSLNFTIMPKNNRSEEKGLISKQSLNLFKKHPGLLAQISFSNKKLKNYREAYTQRSNEIVSSYYQKDLDLLDYTF